jgi:uncharacterized protein (TIGR02466 family)
MTPDTIRQLQRAAQLYARRDLDQAGKICERLLREHPGQVDVMHLLALVARQTGKVEEAERLLLDCLVRAPNRVDIRCNLANLYTVVGRLDDAVREFGDALSKDASARPAAMGLARSLMRLGRHAEALDVLDSLTRAYPEDAEARRLAGDALRCLQRFDAAEAAYRESLELSPDSGAAHHNLAALLAERGRSEEALRLLERAAAFGVRGSQLVCNTASALLALNRLDEAASLLARHLEEAPRDTAAHGLYARVKHFSGETDFSNALAAATRRFPDDVSLRVLHAQLLRGAGSLDDARTVLAAAPGDDDPRIAAELAALWQERGEFERARDAAAKAVELAPGNPQFTDLLIDAQLALGEAAAAMPLIRAARERRPDNQWYLAMEATAARLLGDPLYEVLYDYDRFVRSFELPVPAGWPDIAAFNSGLEAALLGRHNLAAAPLDQSLRRGTQTPRSLLGDPDPHVRAFLEALDEPLAAYCAAVGKDPGHPFTARNTGKTALSGCWSVRLKPGGHHVNHVHSEGWISSAYYVRVPEDCANSHDRSGWLKFGEPRYPVPGVAAARFVPPQPGRLVLFPSYMWHGTVSTAPSSSSRLTVAFDAVPAAR